MAKKVEEEANKQYPINKSKFLNSKGIHEIIKKKRVLKQENIPAMWSGWLVDKTDDAPSPHLLLLMFLMMPLSR